MLLRKMAKLGAQPVSAVDSKILTKTPRQHQAPLTRTQGGIGLKAFEKNSFPAIVTRKRLANQTGVQESRIQMWFQKQRSLFLSRAQGSP
jgi:hypothetical protein